MKKLIIKSILATSVFLLFILSFVYRFIYNPLYDALEKTSLENFVNITESSRISFENVIEKGIENSKSVSSRTMIKEKIIQYKNGMVDLEELKSYTGPKYKDGIKVLENVVYSARIVDHHIIASTGQRPTSIGQVGQVNQLEYEVFQEGSRIYLLVYSPIGSETILGMDIMVFDLSHYLPKITLYDMSINIAKQDERRKFQDKATLNPLITQYKSPAGIVCLNVFYPLQDDTYLHIRAPKDTYYDDFDKITNQSFANLMLIFTISFFCMNGLIIIFAKNKISSLDKSNKKYKKDSHHDALTGAYSRLFLNQWLKDNKGKDLAYSVVFIDMNNFKEINDQHGHSMGDEVLKQVVSNFKNEIREDDYIIRFGGDEFIILIDCTSKDIATKIIQRVSQSLRLGQQPDLNISFSYGISELKNTHEFYEVLEKVDREMYQMKRSRDK